MKSSTWRSHMFQSQLLGMSKDRVYAEQKGKPEKG